MIKSSENENDNEKADHINKTWIHQDIKIETEVQNIACLGKIVSFCNKQHLSNIWGSVN